MPLAALEHTKAAAAAAALQNVALFAYRWTIFASGDEFVNFDPVIRAVETMVDENEWNAFDDIRNAVPERKSAASRLTAKGIE